MPCPFVVLNFYQSKTYAGQGIAPLNDTNTTHYNVRRASLLMVFGGLVPMTLAAPAEAKSCKWVQISYDPATGTGVAACLGRNRP